MVNNTKCAGRSDQIDLFPTRMVPAANRDLLTAPDPRFIIDKPASRLVIDWRR